MVTGRLLFSPKLDIVFKKLFTENVDSLRVFLSDMLGIPLPSIKRLEFTDTEVKPATLHEKLSRVDLCLYLNDKIVDVEIQVRNNHDTEQRTLFYWARLYCSEIKKGNHYNALRPAVTLNLLDYTLFPDREGYSAMVIPTFADTKQEFCRYQEMHFIELSKVKFPVDKTETNAKIERKVQWLLFLNAKTEEDLIMLHDLNDPDVCRIIDAYNAMCEDAEFSRKALNREMAVYDYNSGMAYAREEGERIGEERGEKRGEERGIAISLQALMQNFGCDRETASDLLGLNGDIRQKVFALLDNNQ